MKRLMKGSALLGPLPAVLVSCAAGEEKKGKVIDCTQKGYKLGEKVIRFAKVVVGE